MSNEAVSHRDNFAAAFRALSKSVFAWLMTSETRLSASASLIPVRAATMRTRYARSGPATSPSPRPLVRIPATSRRLAPTSVIAGVAVELEAPPDHFTLDWVMRSLHKRGFGLIFLLLALVAIAPGFSILAGLDSSRDVFCWGLMM